MSDDYAERTRDELREEARDRGVSVDGTKQEIIERLEADDRDGGDGAPARAMDLAPRAAKQLAQLTGRKIDAIAGFAKGDNGWRVMLDVVEVSKVPSSADVLACYEVVVDDDGDLLSYQRVTRYVRGSSRED